MTTRLRLDIAYDGTDFHGWAQQPGQRTVAGELTRALETVIRAPVRPVVAGRTDAGVHASGQVAHVEVADDALAALAPRHLPRTPEAALIGMRRRLAGLLPADVRVPAVTVAPPGFDARFSALRRHYRYRVVCSDWGRPPLDRADTLAWRHQLDVAVMRTAAQPLLGLHDFAAFCKPRPGATTIRDLQRLTVAARPLPAPGYGAVLVEFEVTADAFCHSMVRSLVGVLLAVGEGRRPAGRPAELLAAGARTAEIAVAPAHGLTLIAVDYPPDEELAARAQQTRAVRGGCGCGTQTD